jgi:pyruvate dehydrogenase E2 component (dihydrolipoamide acetyltransferase)
MSELQKIRVPDIGDYKQVPVVAVLVTLGAMIAEGDPLIELESDKATMEVPSPVGGVVSEILVQVGDKLSMGDPILTMNTVATSVSGDTASQISTPATRASPATPPSTPTPVETDANRKASAAPEVGSTSMAARQDAPVHAGPGVRKFARELGVNLGAVQPSGPKGRIVREDVLGFVQAAVSRPVAGPATPNAAAAAAPESGIGLDLPPWPEPDYAKFGPIETVEQSRIQRLSAGNLARNWLMIPHVTNFDKSDITGTEAFRKELNARHSGEGVKVTMLAFMIKAAVSALKAFPRFNVSFSRGRVIQKNYYNIGFAADTPNGLVVAVIPGCDRKGVIEIATEARELAAKARAGTISPREMSGGCFTVSSLGGIGGTGFTPIINAPEVAILGAGKAEIQPVWNGESFEPRLIQPLSLSWDHRAVDGAAAARFLGHISECLSDIRKTSL